MLQQILDFFNMIADFYTAVWGFVWSLIEQLISFFMLIKDGVVTLTTLVIHLPFFLRSLALAGVFVSVLFMIVGRNKGGD